MTETIVVISDMQIPYNDKRATKNLYRFLAEFQPDQIASVGDDVDFPQVSRWNKGMEGEYRGDLQQHISAGIKHFEAIRSVFDGPVHVVRSNHMDRPLTYVRRYAPGLMGLRALTIPGLLDLERLGIEYHEQPYELAPGWLLAHGDEGNLNTTAGGTALGLARKWGTSVVCGHTHRLGIQHDHMGHNLKITQRRYGFEVGNLMRLKDAEYLRTGQANWQQGFGILYVSNKTVDPVPVVVRPNGSFRVEGKEYNA